MPWAKSGWAGGGTYNSLLEFRDPLTVGGDWAQGTLAGFASYSFPLDAEETRLGASANYNAIEVNSGSLRRLGVAGHSYDMALKLSRPLLVAPSFTVGGYFASHYKRSTLESTGVNLSRTIVKSLELGGDFQSFDHHGVWYSAHSVTGGIGAHKFFLKYSGLAARQQAIGNALIALVRVGGQATGSENLACPEHCPDSAT